MNKQQVTTKTKTKTEKKNTYTHTKKTPQQQNNKQINKHTKTPTTFSIKKSTKNFMSNYQQNQIFIHNREWHQTEMIMNQYRSICIIL